MPKLAFLNKKETKQILSQIEDQWGAKLQFGAHALVKNTNNRIFLVNDEIANVDISKLNINSMGIYFCDLEHMIRLSIEGSQLVGPKATKNVLEVTEEQMKHWLLGEDMDIDEAFNGFVIIRHKNDFFGCGKYTKGKLLNYVGKERRVSAVVD